MRYLALVNNGLAQIGVQELINLGLKKSKIKVIGNVLDFEFNDEAKLKSLQSMRRLLHYITVFTAIKNPNTKDTEEIKYDFQLGEPTALEVLKPLSNHTFFIEVENFKGQENRIELAKQASNEILAKIPADVNFKKPDFLLVAYQQKGCFYFGLDVNGEMHKRPYRVFPHSASFTGDYAFFIVQKSGFKKGEKLLVGLGKDGAISIEAARFSSEMVYYFDPATQNFNAARKNSQIAGVEKLINFNKCAVEDLDIKYNEFFFDRIILHITTKDENLINEIYSQTLYVLKPQGSLLLITRDSFDLSVSEKFKLVSVDQLVRGESILKLWLLEKK